jgi:hypothetical protein
MKEVVFTAEEVLHIQNLAQEMPTKFGVPLINVITAAAQRSQKVFEKQTEEAKTPQAQS